MSCCAQTIIPFFNTATTTISYGPALQSQYGAVPSVNVSYWDGTQYVAMGIMTQIKFNYPVTQIEIDHGGISTGLVKIG